MNPLLILDFNAPTPYDPFILNKRVLGGTEATIIRLVEKLGEKIPILVAQNRRHQTTLSRNVIYSPTSLRLLSDKWHAVIVNRNCNIAIDSLAHFKDIPIWVWFHDLIQENHFPYFKAMCENRIGSVFVSNYQRNLMLELCARNGYSPPMEKLVCISNPIDDQLYPDNTPVNKNKLMFASSAVKGLKETVEAFKVLLQYNPAFKLIVTDPGYSRPGLVQMPNVEYMGPLRHEVNIQLFREVLCLFYINRVHPETFGLVLAEANAVGTPVLTHPLGAAPEVLDDPRQYMDTSDLHKVAERIMEWHGGKRPSVKGRDEFRLSSVCKQWEKILNI
jgi:glycosyltransferase involved in cell wall biosynthesis